MLTQPSLVASSSPALRTRPPRFYAGPPASQLAPAPASSPHALARLNLYNLSAWVLRLARRLTRFLPTAAGASRGCALRAGPGCSGGPHRPTFEALPGRPGDGCLCSADSVAPQYEDPGKGVPGHNAGRRRVLMTEGGRSMGLPDCAFPS